MKSFPCKGFSLVEVVIGLVLMATLLVSTLLAYGAHQHQRALANAGIEAVAIADELLHRMSNSRDGIPSVGRGVIPGKPSWFWETTIVGTTLPAGVPLQVIRFQVGRVTSEGAVQSLTSVDVVEAP